MGRQERRDDKSARDARDEATIEQLRRIVNGEQALPPDDKSGGTR